MSKIIAEDCNKLSIFKLKEWGHLKNGSFNCGKITWTDGWGNESNINFSLDLQHNSDWNIELSYRVKGWGDKEWKSIRQKYPIVSTPCQYGGNRHWFVCSVYCNGIYCGRRVAKLYLGGGGSYFACRHCYNLGYQSQMGGTYSDKEINRLYDDIKKWQYKGRPTKKVLRWERMRESRNKNWGNFVYKLVKKNKMI